MPSGWKTTTSSSRLRNSGRKAARTVSSTFSFFCSSLSSGSIRKLEPRLEVRMRMVLRKSTVRPWPSVKPAVVEDLEQDVEDLVVGLLHLVQQDDGVGAAADRLRQLAALLVADIARRRTDQPRDAVLLAVLRHVDPDHRPLVVEEEVRERLGQLRLADAGRAEEEERSGGAVRVGDTGAGAAYGVGDGADGLGLADQPLAELLLHTQQLLGLALQEAALPGYRSRRRPHPRCRPARPPP